MAITVRVNYEIAVTARRAEVDDTELRMYEDDVFTRSIPILSFLDPGAPFKISELGLYRYRAMDYAHRIFFFGAGAPERWPMEDHVFRSGRYLVNATASRALTEREIAAYKKATAKLCAHGRSQQANRNPGGMGAGYKLS